jgi:hypothetical protein
MTADTATRAPILKERDRRVLADLFSIDTRALTAIRIGLALIILVDAFTTPLPTEPRAGFEVVIDYAMVLIVPFAVMLLLGYRTTVATLICWLLYGLQPREAFLAGGLLELEDYMMTLFLFWGAFLPLGAHLSLDGRRNPSASRSGSILSVASAGFLLQLFVIYFSAGATKLHSEWIGDATALQYVLASPKYASELGHAMLAFPGVLAVGSVLTVVLETIGSILLFVPGRTLKVRRILVTAGFILFHVGIAIFMSIGRFPYVMIVVWLAFMPPGVWDRVTRRKVEVSVVRDPSRIRNLIAMLAVIYMFVSCIFTWLYYPDYEGVVSGWQEFGQFMLIYQQWAMFSVPSSI